MRCTACDKALSEHDKLVRTKSGETNDICAECRDIIRDATYKRPTFSELSFHKAMGGGFSSEDIFEHIKQHGSIKTEDIWE